jgi:CheY-like chemotaxis protein
MLEAHGYIVHEARDGSSALELLKSIPLPDVCVTDLKMTPVGGRELIAALRANPIYRTIPLVISTATPTPDLLNSELVLEKPFSMSQLLEAIYVALGKK